MRAAILALTMLLGAGALPIASLRAEPVGEATFVAPTVSRSPPDGTVAALGIGADVFRDDLLLSDETGQAHIRFVDGTVLRLGPGSAVLVDEALYAGGGLVDRLLLYLSRGLFRFVTGDMPASGVSIITPAASIGVRGTTVDIAVDLDGSTRVEVVEGVALVRPLRRDEPVVLGPGSGVTVADPFATPAFDTRWILPDLDVPAGPAPGGTPTGAGGAAQAPGIGVEVGPASVGVGAGDGGIGVDVDAGPAGVEVNASGGGAGGDRGVSAGADAGPAGIDVDNGGGISAGVGVGSIGGGLRLGN